MTEPDLSPDPIWPHLLRGLLKVCAALGATALVHWLLYQAGS